MHQFQRITLLVLLFLLTGCAKNPVTGAHELHLVSTKQEIKMGNSNYLYGQQASGGQYNVDTELTAYVQEVGQKLAKVSDRPDLPYEFVVLNDSVPNAWALPGGKIAVNRGLLTHLNNEAELAAVLGHEITHAAARHGAKSMERQIVLSTGLAAANVALATTLDDDSPLNPEVLMAGAGAAVGLITTKYGREAELEADAYGMKYMVKAGYDPMAAVSLQQTFVKLSENKSPNWLEGLFATHPPSQERVKANLARAQGMPKDLNVGLERYQQKMLPLKKNKLAYESYDKGLKANSAGDHNSALQLALDAIKTQPKEALFYGLKGDALAKQGKKDDALKAYKEAISLDGNYFYYYHQRGLLLEQMGQKNDAKSDLQRSQQLLPTKAADAALKAIG